MTGKNSLIALCSALPVQVSADASASADVPEWIHLLPAGREAMTVDGRGPYKILSLQGIADQLKPGEKLPIDECHSIDRAVPLGLPAPARGWIVALQARDDGLWGQVEWTATGAQLMAEKAYSGISPAILHTKDKVVTRVLRASLINTPNLQGLVALNSEEVTMNWKAKLIELLGLDSTADDAAIEAALTSKMGGTTTALCGADLLEVPQFVALQGQLADITSKYNSLVEDRSRDAATAFVDAAIAEGRAGLKVVRDEYIALHMQDADRAQRMIGAMPKVAGTVVQGDPAGKTASSGLTSEDRLVMSLFGVEEDEYRKQLAGAGITQEAL